MSNDIKTEILSGIWVVRAGGAVIGETGAAVKVSEPGQAPVIYFPRDSIAMAFLEPSGKSSSCPLKGDASHYSIQTKSVLIADAAWSFETPLPGAEQIARYLAFDPDKATVEEV